MDSLREMEQAADWASCARKHERRWNTKPSRRSEPPMPTKMFCSWKFIGKKQTPLEYALRKHIEFWCSSLIETNIDADILSSRLVASCDAQIDICLN